MRILRLSLLFGFIQILGYGLVVERKYQLREKNVNV